MLMVADPVENNLVFQLELTLDRPIGGQNLLNIGAESLWCSNANEPAHYWAGFRIIDISLDAVEIIETLIGAWETDTISH